jgi:ATP-dependent exoDNAse (exonuclease V) beta subunit
MPDLSAAGAKEWARSKEGRDAVIRQMYVAITRAKETLILGGQATGMAVQM